MRQYVVPQKLSESYGTFSHLCPSVAHESAAIHPIQQAACTCGLAPAQSPKAPSICTHAAMLASQSESMHGNHQKILYSNHRLATKRLLAHPASFSAKFLANSSVTVCGFSFKGKSITLSVPIPRQTQRAINGAMPVRRHHANARRAPQPFTLHIPAPLS